MKNLTKITLIAASLISFGANADEKEVAELTNCEKLENLSRAIMRNRQAGIPLKRSIEIIKDSPYLKKITIMAYKDPMYSTENFKQKTINRFADDVYLACLESEISKNEN